MQNTTIPNLTTPKGVDPVFDLLTPEEAAELIRIETDTLNKWRFEGRGPRFIKLGSSVRYRRSDLATYLDQQTYSKSPGRKCRPVLLKS